MSVLVYGLNYRTAPVDLLDRLAVPAEQVPKALASLVARDHVAEAVVLSTCNRVEVYAHVTRYHGGVADIRNFFSETGGLAPETFADHVYDYYADGAAAHLFAVAAGLDSMVVGERQIHLQVRQAFADAEDEGASGRLLQGLFRRALRVGKRARLETGISTGASSMVDVGVEAAAQVLGDLQGATVLIVGAGKMGGMAASRLRPVAGRLLITNRSQEKGRRLADRVAAETLAFKELRKGLAAADLVLASTGAPEPLIFPEDVETVMAQRPGRPLVLVDLAVPRDVHPGCGDRPGVEVLDISHIRSVCEARETGEEVAKARRIVDAEAAAFGSWTRAVRVEPTIAALRQRAEIIRRAELDRFAARLADLEPKEREAVEALSRGIINTLLHEPSVRLKSVADLRGGDLHATALRELFDLPDEPEDGSPDV